MSLKARKGIIFFFSILIMGALLGLIGLIAAFDILYKMMTFFFVGLLIFAGIYVIYDTLTKVVFDDWLKQAYHNELKDIVDRAFENMEKEERQHGSSEAG